MPAQIDPARTAVLALHFQVDVVKREGAFGGPFFAAEVERRGIIPKAKVVLDAARKAGIRVIYTRVCFRPGYPDLIVNSPLFGFVQQTGALVEGSPGAEIIPELAPQPVDRAVQRGAPGALDLRGARSHRQTSQKQRALGREGPTDDRCGAHAVGTQAPAPVP